MSIRTVSAAIVLFAAMQASSFAGVLFSTNVDFNFQNVVGGLNAVQDISVINFGTSSLNDSRLAANGTDGLNLGNQANILDAGDTTNLVGHAKIDRVTLGNGNEVNPLDALQPISFNMVGVVRNITGVISGTGAVIPASGGKLDLFNNFTGGFIDLYLDINPQTNFTANNLANSVDDVLVATFQVLGGQTQFRNNGTGSTNIDAVLVYNLNNFIGLNPSMVPPLFLTLNSTDRVNTSAASRVFNNIGNGIVGGSGGTQIGSGFSPTSTAGSLDVVSTVDGNGSFAAVPEPTSFACLAGLAIAGLAFRRSRKQAN